MVKRYSSKCIFTTIISKIMCVTLQLYQPGTEVLHLPDNAFKTILDRFGEDAVVE